MSMSAHHEDIRKAFQNYSEDVIAWHTGEGDEDSYEFDPLDVAVWRKDANTSRVEITLALGGPTVSIDVDEHDRITFSHSWGYNVALEREQSTFVPYPDGVAVDAWLAYAEMCREVSA